MVRPYSLDLRERVVAAVKAGQSCRAVAKTFEVSVSSVVKWHQRERETGKPAAKPMGGRRPILLAGQHAFIMERIAIKPHITIRGLMAELAARGTKAIYGAVRTYMHRNGQSFKKKACTPASRIDLT
jgi:transposase